MLKRITLFIFSFYTYNAIALTCAGQDISILNTSFFEDLSVPNCTQELFMGEDFLCECAEDYKKFNKEKNQASFSTTNFVKKSEEKLLRMSKGKLASILYDLEYANSMFHISPEEKESMLSGCKLDTLKELTNKMCGNQNMMGNESIDNIIDEIKNEFKIFNGAKLSSNENSFFIRDSKLNSCNIDDAMIYKINNYHVLTSLLIDVQSDKTQREEYYQERLSATPLGRVLMLSSNSKSLNLNKLSNFEDIQKLLNDNENKKNYIENFKTSCQKDLKDVATVLCSNLADSHIPYDEFEMNADIKEQSYSDNDKFNPEKFLNDQSEIVQYCDRKVNATEDKFTPLVNLLKSRKTQDSISKDADQLSNNDLFNPLYISKNKDFQRQQYLTKFEDTREKLCQNRPLTIKKLTEEPYSCHFDSFQKNFDKAISADSANQSLCPYLVLDYILNTPTEELEKEENIDKDLMAYKKNMDENKKSNGSDLMLDFLGVSSPKDVEVFKQAGIERKDPTQSDDKAQEKNTTKNNNVAVQNPNGATNNAITTYGQTNNPTGQTNQASYNGGENYQNSPAYQAMTPQEKSQVGDVERELMRRLMGSKVSESSSAARAEMYEKYSKEMMELAKEKARLEGNKGANSSEDLASYEKKMQDMVNKMREENKKLADSQKNLPANDSNFAASNNSTMPLNNGADKIGNNIASSSPSMNGSGDTINTNSQFNRALNETVNADKYNELTGKTPEKNLNQDRAPASLTKDMGFALIENNQIVDISSLEQVFAQKLKEKKPFIIAQKENPDFKVRIIPGSDDKVTIAPLGDLNNPSYKMFYEEIEQSYQEIQEYHLSELSGKLLEVR